MTNVNCLERDITFLKGLGGLCHMVNLQGQSYSIRSVDVKLSLYGPLARKD